MLVVLLIDLAVPQDGCVIATAGLGVAFLGSLLVSVLVLNWSVKFRTDLSKDDGSWFGKDWFWILAALNPTNYSDDGKKALLTLMATYVTMAALGCAFVFTAVVGCRGP